MDDGGHEKGGQIKVPANSSDSSMDDKDMEANARLVK